MCAQDRGRQQTVRAWCVCMCMQEGTCAQRLRALREIETSVHLPPVLFLSLRTLNTLDMHGAFSAVHTWVLAEAQTHATVLLLSDCWSLFATTAAGRMS